MRADIVAGAVFPDFELTDHTGKRRKLSDLQGRDPLILVLSRGGYCPKDRRQAEGLVQLHREMEVGYSRLRRAACPQRLESDLLAFTLRRSDAYRADVVERALPCAVHAPRIPQVKKGDATRHETTAIRA